MPKQPTILPGPGTGQPMADVALGDIDLPADGLRVYCNVPASFIVAEEVRL